MPSAAEHRALSHQPQERKIEHGRRLALGPAPRDALEHHFTRLPIDPETIGQLILGRTAREVANNDFRRIVAWAAELARGIRRRPQAARGRLSSGRTLGRRLTPGIDEPAPVSVGRGAAGNDAEKIAWLCL